MSENFERIDQIFAQNLSTNSLIQTLLQRVLAAFRAGKPFCRVTDEEQGWLKGSPLIGRELFLEKDQLFLARNYLALQGCFKEIERIAKSPLKEFLPKEKNIFFEKVQKQGFTILTGGPGTGKSTWIAKLAQECTEFSLVIATPTGKSAQRIRESFDEAFVMTLHKLFSQYRSYPFFPFDLFIIDECSMVDLQQLQKFLEKIPQGSRLILVGDHHQLPPVEGCAVFRLLVEAKKEETFVLEKVYRTDRLSLLKIAEDVRIGKFPPFLPLPSLQELVHAHFTNFYQKDFSLQNVTIRMKELQLLTPFKKGMWGYENLNDQFLQLALEKKEIALPVIITKNDEVERVYNGDKGVLVNSKIYLIDGRVVNKSSVQYQLAFALSVHKSQGSEVDSLVLLFPKGSECFGKELIYTAVTRAKKEITIYAEENLMHR